MVSPRRVLSEDIVKKRLPDGTFEEITNTSFDDGSRKVEKKKTLNNGEVIIETSEFPAPSAPLAAEEEAPEPTPELPEKNQETTPPPDIKEVLVTNNELKNGAIEEITETIFVDGSRSVTKKTTLNGTVTIETNEYPAPPDSVPTKKPPVPQSPPQPQPAQQQEEVGGGGDEEEGIVVVATPVKNSDKRKNNRFLCIVIGVLFLVIVVLGTTLGVLFGIKESGGNDNDKKSQGLEEEEKRGVIDSPPSFPTASPPSSVQQPVIPSPTSSRTTSSPISQPNAPPPTPPTTPSFSQPTAPTPSPTGPTEWILSGGSIGRQQNGALGSSIALNAQGNVALTGQPGSDLAQLLIRPDDDTVLLWPTSTFTGFDNSQFGNSSAVSFDGTVVAMGATKFTTTDEGKQTGGISMFRYDSVSNSFLNMGYTLIGYNNGDKFGSSVALSKNGNTVVAGAYQCSVCNGYVRVFDWNGVGWLQRGSNIVGDSSSGLGYDVAMSDDGNRIAVGTFGGEYVEVYEWINFSWRRLGDKIVGSSDNESSFGKSIDLASERGDVLVVGASCGCNNERGGVFVYRWNGSDWVPRGDVIVGKSEGDRAGTSVAVSGDGSMIVCGVDSIYANVMTFEWDGGDWSEVDTSNIVGFPSMTVDVSHDGNVLAVGYPDFEYENVKGGAVLVYDRMQS